jgi:hypothetical protein
MPPGGQREPRPHPKPRSALTITRKITPRPPRSPQITIKPGYSRCPIVLAGPDPAVDQTGRWRIVDLCRYVEERWDVSYSETGMLRLLWSLDLSHRKTRPRHPQSDQKAQQAFKKGALQHA